MEKALLESIVKAPHYFLVHFYERFTCINGAMATGKAYTIVCDNVPVHVYGFTSADEAKAFDPLKLRTLLIGCQNRKEYWDAQDEQTLRQQISDDQRVKDGVYTLNEEARHGAIENLPECARMHVDRTGDLHCGKPENEYGDGCIGGCVLSGYDQDEDIAEGKCPMHLYWNNLYEERMKK